MNKAVGDKIKFLRTQSGLSQEELGKNLYFSNRTISNWENNLREVSMDNLHKVAAFFKVNVSYFLDSQAEPSYQVNNTYRQIKYITIESKSYFFLTVFTLILLNLSLIFIPFNDRETLSVLTLFAWIIFAIYTIFLYQETTKKRTNYLLIPSHTNVFFEHNFSLKNRKKFYFSFILKSLISIILSFIVYSSLYVMIKTVILSEDYDFIFTAIVSFFTFSVSFFHIFYLIRFILTGFPKNSVSYIYTNTEFGIFNLRFIVSLHYGFIIFLSIILINYGFYPFDLQHILINVMGVIALIIYLKTFLDSVIKFFNMYKIVIKETQ